MVKIVKGKEIDDGEDVEGCERKMLFFIVKFKMFLCLIGLSNFFKYFLRVDI